MARLKNIMQNISSIQDTIDRNYSFSIDYLLEIKRNSKNELDVITNIFNLGYMQGMKAEQAKRKKVKEVQNEY